jgi:hypothetical protein
MLKSVCLVGAIVLLAVPALADTPCGSTPLAEVIPAPASVSGKTVAEASTIKHDAFVTVKAYQGKLKTFRECLISQTNALKATVDTAKDDSAKKKIQAQMADMQGVYDKTIDDETKVVNDFLALQTAVCQIVDCTPPKK